MIRRAVRGAAVSVTEIRNVSKSGVLIDLENKRLFNCRFTDCTLQYAGGHCEWDATTIFENCAWEFRGAAARTMRLAGFSFATFNWKNKEFGTH